MKTSKECEEFKYKIIRKNKKNISLKVNEDGTILVSAPFGVSRESIEYIIKIKREWILDKIKKIKRVSKNFINGDQLLYLGHKKLLNIMETKEKEYVEIFGHNINVFVNSKEREHVIRVLKKFYMNEALNIFKERTKLYGKKINKLPTKIFIKDQKTIWGSCSSKGNINYNYRVIMAPIEIVDYIVVHELCHMVHMNHSEAYWNLVGSIIPNYKIRRQWLKVNGTYLKL